MSDKTLLERLSIVQIALKAPKGQYNSFGKYNYRNCEDILEAVKPLLSENALLLVIDDELVQVGDRYYVKATAEISGIEADGWATTATGYAREEETKKGMDGSQITGAASSYARKYALNGLFLIDDTKDSDATNTQSKSKPTSNTLATGLQAKLGGAVKLKGFTEKQKIVDILNGLSHMKYETPSFVALTEAHAQELLKDISKASYEELNMLVPTDPGSS